LLQAQPFSKSLSGLFKALYAYLECVNSDRVNRIEFCLSYLLIGSKDFNNLREAFPYIFPYRIDSQYNIEGLSESLGSIFVGNYNGARLGRVRRRNSL
jgi:hypothetical protein